MLAKVEMTEQFDRAMQSIRYVRTDHFVILICQNCNSVLGAAHLYRKTLDVAHNGVTGRVFPTWATVVRCPVTLTEGFGIPALSCQLRFTLHGFRIATGKGKSREHNYQEKLHHNWLQSNMQRVKARMRRVTTGAEN